MQYLNQKTSIHSQIFSCLNLEILSKQNTLLYS